MPVQQPRYEVFILSPNNAQQLDLITEIESLQVTLAADGNIGTAILTCSPDIITRRHFKTDIRMRILRNGKVLGNRDFYVRAFGPTYEGRLLNFLKGFGNRYWLTRPIVYHASDDDRGVVSGTKADPALKDIVNDELRLDPDQPDVRTLGTLIRIEPDYDVGSTTNMVTAHKKIISVMEDVAVLDNLKFDLVNINATDGEMLFVVKPDFLGKDLRGKVIFDPDLGNFTNAKVEYDYSDEITHVLAGGQGKGSDQITTTATNTARYNSSKFGWTHEMFVSDNRVNDATTLQSVAQAALNANKPKLRVSGNILSTSETEYGIHWDYQDYVTIQVGEVSIDVVLAPVTLSFAGGVESIQLNINAEVLI